jgi:hypothetical protein
MTGQHAPDEGTPNSVAPPGMPGWVKGLLIGLAILVAVVILVMVLSGGQHGPGMHG